MQSLSTEEACFIIAKAREFSVKEAEVEPDRASNPSEEDERIVLQENPTDTSQEELVAAIRLLDDDARVELLALVLIGRGDLAAEQWNEAVTTARENPDHRTARHLADMPLLGDYIEEGLSLRGFTCG